MKKIPTLFIRTFDSHRVVDIKDEITPGCEDAFLRGIATLKIDGACCAIIDGTLYKRYDAKRGKKPPVGAIPCCDPDPVTGHWPHWLKVDGANPSDRWFCEAFNNTFNYALARKLLPLKDGTYEAIVVHFQGNPYGLDGDVLCKHGSVEIEVERTFDGIKSFLETNELEGLVFWLNGEPVCKIKRKDFGFVWPVKEVADE
jgi:hypothetical protein